MGDENKVLNLSLLNGDSLYLLNNVVNEIGNDILYRLKLSINNLTDYYHGIDSEVQINKLIDLYNAMQEIENDVAQIAIGLIKVARNYRRVQISFGIKKEELTVPKYEKKNRFESIVDKRDRIEITEDVISTLKDIDILNELIERYERELKTSYIKIKDNWLLGNGHDKMEMLFNSAIIKVEKYKSIMLKSIGEVKQAINNYDFAINN